MSLLNDKVKKSIIYLRKIIKKGAFNDEERKKFEDIDNKQVFLKAFKNGDWRVLCSGLVLPQGVSLEDAFPELGLFEWAQDYFSYLDYLKLVDSQ